MLRHSRLKVIFVDRVQCMIIDILICVTVIIIDIEISRSSIIRGLISCNAVNVSAFFKEKRKKFWLTVP